MGEICTGIGFYHLICSISSIVRENTFIAKLIGIGVRSVTC